jgi:hypothetical protein
VHSICTTLAVAVAVAVAVVCTVQGKEFMLRALTALLVVAMTTMPSFDEKPSISASNCVSTDSLSSTIAESELPERTLAT